MSALAFRNARPNKRRRVEHIRAPAIDPFGFDLGPYMALVSEDYRFPEQSHRIVNYISGFDAEGVAQYERPQKVWQTESINGLFVKFQGDNTKVFISGMHTKHTESMYRMAHGIKAALKRMPECQLARKVSSSFKEVDISRALKQKRHKSTNVLYLKAIHQGEWVVLKTTTDPAMQLKYILDAVIHYHVWRNADRYVTKLHFVAFRGDALVVCSGQMEEPSVYGFMNTLHQKYRPDRLVYTMVESFCLAIRKLQKDAQFTHRDCHVSNVYYNMRKKCTRFIDFDWSCFRCTVRPPGTSVSRHKIISVPRFLYDTTRPQYGNNRSVDCAVFFRTLGNSLDHCPIFEQEIYRPLMRRYEVDSREILQRKMRQGDLAALQLYKQSTINGKASGRFGHTYGIMRQKENYDYSLGYYTYTSMTPEMILRFLRENKFF